ncbi:MAG TPA: N-acetyl sugar amidotransferase [Gammaproteobacteria bacterium]|nr:N-acetyl sugar amidotransferase [Gammaproteobacteria bacterium]
MTAPNYCRKCILPDTRPGVRLDAEGICNGCRNAEVKARIDWRQRAAEFAALAAEAKARGAEYDCVIPVSGGKDSHWQLLTCLEHGLHPLCVTYAYPGATELGKANLDNLVRQGVDHLTLRVNPKVERTFTEKAFRRKGISGLVSHMGIFAFPIKVAARFGIPLVIYGENSALEYGTEDEALIGARLDRRWLQSFGVTDNTTAADWIDADLSAQDLAPYFLPADEELEGRQIKALFLGWYFRWDPQNSFRIASAHGFKARAEGARVGHLNYVNIDDDFIAIHHHPKWHKYGITRTWDTLSIEIRMGRMTREQAIANLRAAGDETPWRDIERFCDYVGITVPEYFEIVEGFRNPKIWTRRGDRWVIDGFLVDDFAWPADSVL